MLSFDKDLVCIGRVEMQLPDLVPEETSITTFHMSRKRKKLSISEFERAADKRLPQNQGKAAVENYLVQHRICCQLIFICCSLVLSNLWAGQWCVWNQDGSILCKGDSGEGKSPSYQIYNKAFWAKLQALPWLYITSWLFFQLGALCVLKCLQRKQSLSSPELQ